MRCAWWSCHWHSLRSALLPISATMSRSIDQQGFCLVANWKVLRWVLECQAAGDGGHITISMHR